MPDARKAFALVDFNLNKVMVDVGRYMSEHTDFNKEELDGRAKS